MIAEKLILIIVFEIWTDILCMNDFKTNKHIIMKCSNFVYPIMLNKILCQSMHSLNFRPELFKACVIFPSQIDTLEEIVYFAENSHILLIQYYIIRHLL